MFVDAAPSVCRLVFLSFDGAFHFLNWGLWAKRHYRSVRRPFLQMNFGLSSDKLMLNASSVKRNKRL